MQPKHAGMGDGGMREGVSCSYQTTNANAMGKKNHCGESRTDPQVLEPVSLSKKRTPVRQCGQDARRNQPTTSFWVPPH